MKNDEFIEKVVSLSPRIYPMVARLLGNNGEAEDAVQETMLKLWKRRNSLDTHPNLQGFVFLTAKNHCLDVLKRRKHIFEEIGYTDIRDHSGNNKEYEDVEHYNFMKEVINNLPEKYREVIILRDLDGLEFDEISVITGKTTEYLRVILSRARKSVAKEISEIYSYERATGR